MRDATLVLALVACAVAAFLCLYVILAPGPGLPALTRRIVRSARTFARAGPRNRSAPRDRKVALAQQMPAFLDILTLGLLAGLSFDASLELYCKRYNTELSELLWDTMQLWRIGVESRASALEHMASEEGVTSLQRFASTVSEALAFGTPLSQTLERQAQVIREEQKSLIEEEIEKAPVKMLIPLTTLIVPAMLLAILGPLLAPALGIG